MGRRRGRTQYHGVLLKQSMSLKRNGVVDLGRRCLNVRGLKLVMGDAMFDDWLTVHNMVRMWASQVGMMDMRMGNWPMYVR